MTSPPDPADGGGPDGNDVSGDLLVRVRSVMPELRPSQRRVAEAIIERPAWVAESSIETVAAGCATSTTTISRLVRALGFANYREFRAALSRAAAIEAGTRPSEGPSGDIDRDDSLADLVTKIGHNETQAVAETARNLDLEQLEAAVAAVAGARRIEIAGVGASALVGSDLRQKLHRIGLAASVWTEAHAAATAASLLGVSDVLIAISHSGKTAELLTAVEIAGQGGARTIAITNFARSPLARRAEIVLTTAAREATFRSGATTSRIAQLVVVDALFVGVAVSSFDASTESLRLTREAVEELRRDH